MKLKRIETISAILMLILTVAVSSRCSLTEENWTALLLTNEKYLLYLLGTLGSCIFCFLLYQFSVCTKKPLKTACILTSLCMPLSLMFVFDPEIHPILSSLHLAFAYAYFFGVNATFIASLIALHFREVILFRRIMQTYMMILFVCTACFMHYMSINTLFELVFTCSMTLLLVYSLHVLK